MQPKEQICCPDEQQQSRLCMQYGTHECMKDKKRSGYMK